MAADGVASGSVPIAAFQAPLRWGAAGAMSPAAAFSLPVGTVTFLLTDIEGSTRMWEREDTDAMRSALVLHGALIAQAVARHGGVQPQEQGEGDSTVSAFARPSDALRAARDSQRALAAADWPTAAPVRVRMAVHTGEAQLRDEANYAGQAIIRTARLRGLGHGGQVLVSQATRDLAVDQLGDEIAMRTLGQHVLRDLGRPEQVWQLDDPTLPDEFPELVSAMTSTPHNLPISLSPFIGRVAEIATLARLVSNERLVTATGTGGAGKTRLAQQVMAESLEGFPDGVRWVELAPLDATAVGPAIAAVLGLRDASGDIAAALAGAIGSQRLLLGVDNCEHVAVTVRDLLSHLLGRCPNLHVLATSRVTLDVPGEIAWRVPPMSLPATGAATDVFALSQFDAVALFADRASRARSSFVVDTANAPAIAELCVRLDGLPLAIELAAARCRLLPPAQILAGLADTFRLLTGGAATVMPRQQTLEASIAWSHDLLSADEQTLLRRLSVFVGGWTLEAAEAVCGDEHIDSYAVFDLLDRLVSHSLVHADEATSGARFRMLETVRQFARRALDRDAPDATRTLDAHARWGAAWVRGRHTSLRSGGAGDLVDELGREQPNLDAAIERLSDLDPVTVVDILFSLLPMWSLDPARTAAMARVGERLIDRLGPAATGRSWFVFAFAAQYQGFGPEVFAAFDRAADLADAEQDRAVEAYARFSPDVLRLMTALADGEQVVLRFGALREAGDSFLLARALASASMIASVVGLVELSRVTLGELAALPERDHPAVAALAAIAQVSLHTHDGRPLEVIAAAERTFALRPGSLQAGNVYRHAHSAAAQARVALPPTLATFPTTADYSHPWIAAVAPLYTFIGELVTGCRAEVGLWDRRSYVEVRSRAQVGMGRSLQFDFYALLAGLDIALLPGEDSGNLMDQYGFAQLIEAIDAEAAGDLVGAMALVAESIRIVADSQGWGPGVAALEHAARLMVAGGAFRDAARVYGATAAFREERHLHRFWFMEEADAPAEAAIREALGDEAEVAMSEGRSLTMEQACEYVLRRRSAHTSATTGWAALTPTEAKVAELVAAGRTNAVVGRELLMSPETVKTHLSRVFAKLGVKNRQQLAFEFARRPG